MTRNQIIASAAALAIVAGGGGYLLGARGDGHAGEAPHAEGDGHAHGPEEGKAAGAEKALPEGRIVVTPAQVVAAGIAVAPAVETRAGGEVLAAGAIVPATNATGHVTARTTGVVSRLLVQVGDRVGAGAGLAVIDSREAAEAQAALAAARSRLALAEKTFAREQGLYQARVTARADFEQAGAALEAARIEARSAGQALAALGLSPSGGSRLFTLRSPVAGEVTTVSVTPGEYVSAERELFQVADRRAIWAELRVPARELERVQAGQRVRVTVQGASHDHPATLRFLSPAVDTASGAARAIAVVQNPDGELRVGQSVTARIVTPGGPLAPAVPRAAVQEVEGRTVVFVRTADGFQARPVTLGAGTDAAVPVLSGLRVGERVATVNSFVLKAELGKGEAEHDH